MPLSVQKTATDCLRLKTPIKVHRDLFARLGNFSKELHFREQLQEIRSHHCHFALPPKYISPHPRLSPLPAIHFDHYNSSVTNMDGPTPGEVDAELIRHGFPLGTCLNFIQDSAENLYAFCGNISGLTLDVQAEVAFKLALLDMSLDKVDEYEVTSLGARDFRSGELPFNLGYFVMDSYGRVIVVKDKTDIIFLKKSTENKIKPVRTWQMKDRLRSKIDNEIAEQTIGQVLPAHESGYWIMAMGDKDDDIPAYVGKISDSGRVLDVHVFQGEIIENGMAVDQTGAYVLTDKALYKFSQNSDGRIHDAWRWPEHGSYPTVPKPGLISHGSGSSPTLLGDYDDLVAITDNADERVNLLVFDRHSGQKFCEEPLFKKNKSANENTVVGYGDSIITQNWYNSPPIDDNMWTLEPGLWRIDVRKDRSGCNIKWTNDEFASTATVRLSTRTGLLYGTVQTGEDDEYAMALVDFHTGKIVQQVPMPGSGRKYRIGMSPAYFVPGGRLAQPVRRGVVIFKNT